LIVRIIYIIAFSTNKITGDAVSYNTYALSILEADWLANSDFIGNSREPVYPLFLAFIYVLFGKNNFMAVYVAQAVISTLTILYIFKLSNIFFNQKISILALIWSAFYISYLRFSALILRETIIFFLIISVFYYLWLLINSNKKSILFKNKYFWFFIFIFSTLIHLDARYLIFIPFLSILFIYYNGIRYGLQQYALILFCIIVLIIPWTLRNYFAYDAFVLINTRTIDLRPKNDRENIFEKRFENNVINFGSINHSEINKNYPQNDERLLIKEGFNPRARSAEEVNAIVKDIYPDSTFFGRKLYWLKEFWRVARFKADYFPFPDARFQGVWSLKHNVSSILCFGLLIPFATIGIIIMLKEKHKASLFLLLPILVQTLIHMLMWSRDRYRMPIDAFIIIIAAYGIYWCYDYYIIRGNKARNGIS
tara:strand:+ start:19763 stop:21031 length:1269 start_codon:yes stop_codon:yes gene_type:complete